MVGSAFDGADGYRWFVFARSSNPRLMEIIHRMSVSSSDGACNELAAIGAAIRH
jgi:hypothetical protein